MLLEALLYVTTPCPKHLRAMGYLKELIGIQARAVRCKKAWEPHHDHCHRVIKEWVADMSSPKQRVIIMGAALAMDAPIKELSAVFDEVVLIDLLHPWWSERRPNNVRTIVTDLTGVLDQVYVAGNPVPSTPPSLPKADLYLSVNIASQLPCIVGEWLADQGVGEEALSDWSCGVVEAHFSWLQSLPGRVGLITETMERVVKDGQTEQRSAPLHGAQVPPTDQSWIWEIAPVGEFYPDKSIVLDISSGLINP